MESSQNKMSVQWGSEIRTCPVFEWLKKVGLGPDHSKTGLLDSLDPLIYIYFSFLNKKWSRLVAILNCPDLEW